jgi:chromosome segregation ATPase
MAEDLNGFTGEDIVPPTYPQYTNLALGDGLFDQLMAAVEGHLDKQYDGMRLRGDEYAKVYVGSIQGVMVNTTQYLIGIMLLDQQKAKLEAETSLTYKQEEKIDNEVALLELEREKLKFQIQQLYPLELQKLEAEVYKIQKEGELIDKQIEKMDAEILFLDAQKDMMLKQAQKIDKEIEFMGWKILTEKANTVAGTAESGSLIGKQIALLTAQHYGFAGDIRTKIAKLHADFQSVNQTVLEIPDATGLNETNTVSAISSAASIASDIMLIG